MTVEQRARRQVLGEAAPGRDAARRGHLQALVAEGPAHVGLGDRPAVKVGAGTGKATATFCPLDARTGSDAR